VTETARRASAPGEEPTFDYALATAVPWSISCRCGSPACRCLITGNDWWRPELQERYREHFSPFINARIGE